VLLSDDFTLKIADFGFAGALSGRDGSGYMRTILGTKPYMAPELNERKKYRGEQVDIFAAGVILFIMVSGAPPFNAATKDEFYYKFIVHKKYELFWKYHSKGKPAGEHFFSPEFKDLMQRILAYNPDERPTIEGLY
jgi:serine/threonine protein kinase